MKKSLFKALFIVSLLAVSTLAMAQQRESRDSRDDRGWDDRGRDDRGRDGRDRNERDRRDRSDWGDRNRDRNDYGSKDGIRILAATYGTDHQYCDATAFFKKKCQWNERCFIEANNYLCGDPGRGFDKYLVLEYQCGQTRQTIEVDERDSMSITCKSNRPGPRPQPGNQPRPGTQPAPRPAPHQEMTIVIHDAVYAWKNRGCNAERAVTNICEGKTSCNVFATNHLCGDPAKGEDKILEINYSCQGPRGRSGQQKTVRIGERGYSTLRCE